MENKRKSLILLIVGIFVILIVVVGATYAYFQSVNGNTTIANINATTGTIDNLTFSMDDIDVSTENIEDNHNIDKEDSSKIVINATEENFGKNGKSLGDGIKAKAHLKANNTTNVASSKYNVFFVMEEKENKLIYTMDSKHPELILTVNGPNGEIKEIDGLVYHEKDEKNPNDVSGFDITGKSGSFAIKVGEEIEVTLDDNGEKEEEWEIKVTLINLDNDQNRNTGKEVTGEVVITTDTMETYKLAHVNSIKDTSSTANSITTTMEYETGSKEIVSYYFGIKEIGEVEPISLEDGIKWEEGKGATHTFEGLNENYKYKIYCYVVDSEGIKSNIYGTEIENIVTTEKAPEVANIKVVEKSYDKIKIEVEGKKGTNEIVGYEYKISGATIDPAIIEEIGKNTYTFEGLEESQEYKIEVRAKDSKENYSAVNTITERTRESYYHETCNDGSGACKIAKLSINDNSIIFHNLEDATKKDFLNYSLVANDDSYRYSGADVNDYVCFGTDTCSNTENYDNLYRIIGVFKNEETNNYEMKLIKADYANKELLGSGTIKPTDETIDLSINGSYTNIVYSKTSGSDRDRDALAHRYKGLLSQIDAYKWQENGDTSTIADWPTSLLNTIHLNTNFIKTIDTNWLEIITDHKWHYKGSSFINIMTTNAKISYDYELGNFADNVLTKPTKIGLAYVSDYYYAATSNNWQNCGCNGDCSNPTYNGNLDEYGIPYLDYITGSPDLDYRAAINANWLANGFQQIFITQVSDDKTRIFCGAHSGAVGSCSAGNDFLSFLPTFYLKSNVKINDGTGTINDPYTLVIS